MVAGLFVANFISLVLGAYLLSDTDKEVQTGFQYAAMGTNMIFLGIYFHGQIQKISDTVKNEVKEILKN